jgi:hypothetical protein
VRVLGHLDVVISIALATLGLFIGIAAATEGGARKRLLLASTAEAAVTMLAVAGAILVLLGVWAIPLLLGPQSSRWRWAASAAASAAPSVEVGDERARRIAARVADLDDVLPILAGAIIVATLGTGGMPAALNVLAAVGIGLAVAAGGWLLFEQSAGAERGVFVLGTIALLGGCAAYIEGLPGARRHGRRLVLGADVRDRPTGSWRTNCARCSTRWSCAAHRDRSGTVAEHRWHLALCPYVVFRVAGKLVGGWAASRIAPEVAPSDLGAYLIPPGVIGIALR